MASPSCTEGAAGNVYASQTLAAGAAVNVEINGLAKFKTELQQKATSGGTVAATAGLQIQDYGMFTGTSGIVDTVPRFQAILPVLATSTTYYRSHPMDTLRIRETLTNLDASNAITVQITSTTLDSIA